LSHIHSVCVHTCNAPCPHTNPLGIYVEHVAGKVSRVSEAASILLHLLCQRKFNVLLR